MKPRIVHNLCPIRKILSKQDVKKPSKNVWKIQTASLKINSLVFWNQAFSKEVVLASSLDNQFSAGQEIFLDASQALLMNIYSQTSKIVERKKKEKKRNWVPFWCVLCSLSYIACKIPWQTSKCEQIQYSPIVPGWPVPPCNWWTQLQRHWVKLLKLFVGAIAHRFPKEDSASLENNFHVYHQILTKSLSRNQKKWEMSWLWVQFKLKLNWSMLA